MTPGDALDGVAVTIDGSPPPMAPEVITRDAANRPTIRAIKLAEPLRLDGRLDERVYGEEPPFGGFVQVVPDYGAPASERSEVWVMFDATTIYVAGRMWDSAPPDRWVANELRRDTNQLRQNDHLGVMFDTFYDRRSGFMFYTNPLGALADYSVIDEGQPNTDWNPVWNVRTGRFDGGWTVELAVPFKTLRYKSGVNQVWGIQMRRSIRRKNEWAYLSPVPLALAGPQALNRVSSAGTLVGLDLPPASKNLEIKPYAISRLSTDRVRVPPVANDLDGDVGGDLKYGVTANLTADVTVNTDFAQVEVDEQQTNLTRFSLFFPEKRDFFLEGRGIFDFARGGAGAQGGTATASDTPTLFYSRRIGLNRGRVVPIDVGGRLTGKIGAYSVGVVNIQQGGEDIGGSEPTNFTVLRLKRDILRRSTIGAMLTNRSNATLGSGSNQAYGVDAAFSFYQNVSMGAYYAQTRTPGLDVADDSYQGRFDYSADRYGLRAEYLKVGDNFNPEVGFLRRDDFRRSFGSLRFSPRPRSGPVRKYTFEGSLEYFENDSL
ncbi:MAG: carbohydrate binding family 9 domain-containing protein, partial [Acidobacteria bacterium]|nr:carbohydrate binding family 9 domain-containing protein [Acidobacteriota bacterium]